MASWVRLHAHSCRHICACMNGQVCARHSCILNELTSQLMEWICETMLRKVTGQPTECVDSVSWLVSLWSPVTPRNWLVTPRSDILRELTRTWNTSDTGYIHSSIEFLLALVSFWVQYRRPGRYFSNPKIADWFGAWLCQHSTDYWESCKYVNCSRKLTY